MKLQRTGVLEGLYSSLLEVLLTCMQGQCMQRLLAFLKKKINVIMVTFLYVYYFLNSIKLGFILSYIWELMRLVWRALYLLIYFLHILLFYHLPGVFFQNKLSGGSDADINYIFSVFLQVHLELFSFLVWIDQQLINGKQNKKL